MAFLCDFHSHLYPSYSLDEAFSAAASRLQRLAEGDPAPCYGLALVERYDCRFFQALRNESSSLLRTWSVEPTADPSALLLRKNGAELLLFAGRQIVCRERVELLCYGADAEIPDGLDAGETLAAISQAGGAAALNWALGKWMFKRKPVVERIIEDAAPGTLAICDTSLRPVGWSEPALFSRARERGLQIVCGSDPLPQPGEERLLGSYAVRSPAPFDGKNPVSALKAILTARAPAELIGKRSSPPAAIKRMVRHARSK